MSTTINTYIPPQSPLVSEGTEKFQLMHTSPENEQPKPLSPSNIYNMPVLQSPLDVSISQIDGTNEAVTRGPLPPPPDIYSYIDTFDDIYLTPTNNEGNYPWSHKLYNNPPKVEQMTNLQKHENLPTNSGRQIDQNSIWSESWIPKFQHTAVNHAIQVNNHKKTIKKVSISRALNNAFNFETVMMQSTVLHNMDASSNHTISKSTPICA
ncbi:unnamed protein product [Heterobilharzia americana]|nr:unnamed protein product [Heterobilharzia americana]